MTFSLDIWHICHVNLTQLRSRLRPHKSYNTKCSNDVNIFYGRVVWHHICLIICQVLCTKVIHLTASVLLDQTTSSVNTVEPCTLHTKQPGTGKLHININLVNVDGRKHVLEHGCHQLEVHAITTEVVHNQQRMTKELRLRCLVSLQRRDNVSAQWIRMHLERHRWTARQTH